MVKKVLRSGGVILNIFWKASFIVNFFRGMYDLKEDLSYLSILISKFTGGLFGHVFVPIVYNIPPKPNDQLSSTHTHPDCKFDPARFVT